MILSSQLINNFFTVTFIVDRFVDVKPYERIKYQL